METRDQQDYQICKKPQKALETLSLRELFLHWSYLLRQMSMHPMFEQMIQIDLTMSESQVLNHLQHRSLTIAEAAEYLLITHSAASRAVDRLVRDGFVSRAENPADRRQKQLLLTEKGTALLENLNSIWASGIERLVASLSSEEQEQFRLLIVHMMAAYSDEAGPRPVDE
jgi:DNA-binding MarR family transcriptional regulator